LHPTFHTVSPFVCQSHIPFTFFPQPQKSFSRRALALPAQESRPVSAAGPRAVKRNRFFIRPAAVFRCVQALSGTPFASPVPVMR